MTILSSIYHIYNLLFGSLYNILKVCINYNDINEEELDIEYHSITSKRNI